MVLAAHRTPVRGPLVAATVETVRFTRPERVDFGLVRGPVPHVVERFTLTSTDTGTNLDYCGELGSDMWRIGRRWGDRVARRWDAVATSLKAIKAEAEHGASVSARTQSTSLCLTSTAARKRGKRRAGNPLRRTRPFHEPGGSAAQAG